MKTEPIGSLDPRLYREIVRRALDEDIRLGDRTTNSLALSEQRATGKIIVKAPCVLAGLEVAIEAFIQLDSKAEVTRLRCDGDSCEPGSPVVTITGLAAALLTAERTALNFLQRLSGIATLTRCYVEAAAGRITILDTRKTTPMLRAVEKYAVRVGGGLNHRFGLNDGLLIKDNHTQLVGSVGDAVKQVRAAGHDMPIEIEAQNMAEVCEALEAGVDIILVDNFEIDDVREAVRITGGRAKIEVSGGITLDRVDEIAASGVDYVSVGALTHSAPAVDANFEMQAETTTGQTSSVASFQ